MAITKLMRIKERPSGNPSAGLKKCLEYICNPEKTEDGMLIRGNAGGSPDVIYTNMLLNKHFWHREHGSQGFHYVLSFPPEEEVSAELALQVAEEFCQELLQDQYIYCIACHSDTGHRHCHICFDAVNVRTGKIFRSPRYDWHERIQPITDQLCLKYGLSALSYDESRERSSMYHKDWEGLNEDGIPKKAVRWNDIIRDDLEECLRTSDTWEGFLQRLAELHYEYRDGKYLSLKPYGKEKAVRSIRLGPGYSKEALQKRVREKEAAPAGKTRPTLYGDPVPVYRAAAGCLHRKKTFSSFQKEYFRRWGRLSCIRRNHSLPTWKYKKDLTRLGSMTDQLAYLFDHDITSLEEIPQRLQELQKSRGTEAARERKILRGILSEARLAREAEDILRESSMYELPMPDLEPIRQIHVNKVLFQDADLSGETFLVRLPGRQVSARLYRADSRIYNGGDAISSYIYPEAEYSLVDEAGKWFSHISGKELAKHFKTREIARTEGGTKWKR